MRVNAEGRSAAAQREIKIPLKLEHSHRLVERDHYIYMTLFMFLDQLVPYVNVLSMSEGYNRPYVVLCSAPASKIAIDLLMRELTKEDQGMPDVRGSIGPTKVAIKKSVLGRTDPINQRSIANKHPTYRQLP